MNEVNWNAINVNTVIRIFIELIFDTVPIVIVNPIIYMFTQLILIDVYCQS